MRLALGLEAARTLCKQPDLAKRIIGAAEAVGKIATAMTAVIAVPIAARKFYQEFIEEEDSSAT
jgi:hypothetical protein